MPLRHALVQRGRVPRSCLTWPCASQVPRMQTFSDAELVSDETLAPLVLTHVHLGFDQQDTRP